MPKVTCSPWVPTSAKKADRKPERCGAGALVDQVARTRRARPPTKAAPNRPVTASHFSVCVWSEPVHRQHGEAVGDRGDQQEGGVERDQRQFEQVARARARRRGWRRARRRWRRGPRRSGSRSSGRSRSRGWSSRPRRGACSSAQVEVAGRSPSRRCAHRIRPSRRAAGSARPRPPRPRRRGCRSRGCS